VSIGSGAGGRRGFVASRRITLSVATWSKIDAAVAQANASYTMTHDHAGSWTASDLIDELIAERALAAATASLGRGARSAEV
jgi:hypothetical protein